MLSHEISVNIMDYVLKFAGKSTCIVVLRDQMKEFDSKI